MSTQRLADPLLATMVDMVLGTGCNLVEGSLIWSALQHRYLELDYQGLNLEQV